MASEIEKTAREIGNKKMSEIEKTAREIEVFCNKFVKFNEGLIDTGKETDFKTQDKLEKIGKVLKNFYMKSSGIEEALRLNESQFEEGRLERDAYERKLRELTEDMTSLKFDFNKCSAEIETFERRVSALFNLEPILSTFMIKEKGSERVISDVERQKIISAEGSDLKQEALEGKSQDVNYPETYIQLGISYLKSKKPEKAKECFESALFSRPNNATIWFHLGHANSELGNHPEATRCYLKVLDINSRHTDALCDLGFTYGQLGKHKQARKCYKKLTEINPNDAKAWTGLGVTLYSMGQFKQAKESLEKAIQIDPKFGLAWYNLGLVYSSLGYHQESKRCYDQAKKLGF
jgi:tetratricopeptide (TPR) repeat protein